VRETIRSQLRTALLVWAAAGLAFILGYGAAVAVTILGLFESARSFSSDNPTLSGIGPMMLGTGLQLLLVFVFLNIRDRFEHRCWQIIAADIGLPVGDAMSTPVVAQLADGEDRFASDVRARQSRHLSKRLGVLIAQAWPDRSGD